MTQTSASFLVGILLLPFQLIWAQQAFECKGDFYFVHNENDGAHFYAFTYDPATSGGIAEPLFTISNFNSINAIGYRIDDDLIYGIDEQTNKLVKIGSDGVIQTLAQLSGVPAEAGDVSPDGRYLITISKDATLLVKIDLNDASFNTEFIPVTPVNSSTPLQCSDIAFWPNSNELYGYDEVSGRLFTIDIDDGLLNNVFYPQTFFYNQVPALFFDWQRRLYGISREPSSNDCQLSQFSLQSNAVEELGDLDSFDGILDGCSCPFGVRLYKTVRPTAIRPCETAYYTFKVTNYTGEELAGYTLRDNLPPGLDIKGIEYNGLNATPEINLGNQVILSGFSLPSKSDSLVVRVESDALTSGYFPNQAILESSSPPFNTLSDNPETVNFLDPTFIELLPEEEGMDLCAEKSKKVFAPSAYSPNGDQVNDVFYLQTANQISFENFEIYNRWGNLVWSKDSGKTNDPQQAWEGIDPKGNYLPNGIYAWKAKLTFLDGNTFSYSGNVLLAR